MLIFVNYVNRHSFFIPFMIGAALCSIVGGFYSLAMTVLVVYLGLKMLRILTKSVVQSA